MFWKKKVTEEVVNHVEVFYSNVKPEFRPFYGDQRLIVKEEYDRLDKKINLILSHLNLEYVPETEKKEPAKLVEKKSDNIDHEILARYLALNYISGSGKCPDKKEQPKKKKRGRPKKK